MCNQSSREQSDRDISFHTLCDTEVEMGHCPVQICQSLRIDLRHLINSDKSLTVAGEAHM